MTKDSGPCKAIIQLVRVESSSQYLPGVPDTVEHLLKTYKMLCPEISIWWSKSSKPNLSKADTCLKRTKVLAPEMSALDRFHCNFYGECRTALWRDLIKENLFFYHKMFHINTYKIHYLDIWSKELKIASQKDIFERLLTFFWLVVRYKIVGIEITIFCVWDVSCVRKWGKVYYFVVVHCKLPWTASSIGILIKDLALVESGGILGQRPNMNP